MTRTRSQRALEEVETPLELTPARMPLWVWLLLGGLLVVIFIAIVANAAGVDTSEPEVVIDPLGLGEDEAPPPDDEPVIVIDDDAEVEADPTGTVLADGDPILPIPPETLEPYEDRAVEAVAVPVYSVVADEGFWVGETEMDRLYVIIRTGGAESPPNVSPGGRVSFVGQLQSIGDPDDFDDQYLLTDAEGAGQLRAQGYYVAVADVEVVE